MFKFYYISFKKYGTIWDGLLLFLSFILIVLSLLGLLQKKIFLTDLGFGFLGILLAMVIFSKLKKKTLEENTLQNNQIVSISKPIYSEKLKRGFWGWFAPVLFLLNIPVFIILLRTPDLGLGGFWLFFHGFALFTALPAVIIVLVKPTKTIKIFANIFVILILWSSTFFQILFGVAAIKEPFLDKGKEQIIEKINVATKNNIGQNEVVIKGIEKNIFLVPEGDMGFVIMPTSFHINEKEYREIFQKIFINSGKKITFVNDVIPDTFLEMNFSGETGIIKPGNYLVIKTGIYYGDDYITDDFLKSKN